MKPRPNPTAPQAFADCGCYWNDAGELVRCANCADLAAQEGLIVKAQPVTFPAPRAYVHGPDCPCRRCLPPPPDDQRRPTRRQARAIARLKIAGQSDIEVPDDATCRRIRNTGVILVSAWVRVYDGDGDDFPEVKTS